MTDKEGGAELHIDTFYYILATAELQKFQYINMHTSVHRRTTALMLHPELHSFSCF
jgi:hypothetical protein